MSFGRYLAGAVLTVVCLGALGLGARRARARLWPAWSGALAWVADGVLLAGALVVILEVLGIAGLLDLPAIAVACVAAGTGTRWWLRGPATARQAAAAPGGPPLSALERGCAVLAIASVAAPWLGWTVYAYRHGMATADTLWYHLPQAARWIQLGDIRHLQYFDHDPITAFYPGNAELFHALGMVLFASDVLSPLINLGWALLALLAAWSIGRRFGRPAHAALALALLLATPALVDTQPGGAYNDTACIALVLSAAAVLLHGGLRPRALALAGTACGVALGVKFTMLVIPIALGLAVVALPAAWPRARRAALWAGALVVFGGYWYARNAIRTGTPLPSLPLGLGHLLALPHVSEPAFSVARNLTSGHVWSAYYLPGLHSALGVAWWAILAVAALGLIGPVARGGPAILRALGAVGLVGVLAYLVTPQFLGFPTAPIFFVYNLRYVAVPLALGLALAPALLPRERVRLAHVALAAGAAVLVATELDPAVWPTALRAHPFATPISGSAAVIGALIAAAGAALALALGTPAVRRRLRRPGALPHRWPDRPRARAAPAAAAALALALAGWPVASAYAHDRYAATNPIPRIFAWARTVQHARIGIVGIVAQYPLYGPRLSNYVQYVGTPTPHGGFADITSCAGWREALDAGHYGWVVIAPPSFPLSATAAPQLAWTEGAPGAQVVIRERAAGAPAGDEAVLLRLNGPLAPDRCPRT